LSGLDLSSYARNVIYYNLKDSIMGNKV